MRDAPPERVPDHPHSADDPSLSDTIAPGPGELASADTIAPDPGALASADTIAPDPGALASADTIAPREVSASGGHRRGIGTPGERLGRYIVLERLGAGGMGVVVAAYDPQLDRKVAIKTLLPSMHGGTQGRARLLREAQALAKLSHPNIVGIHDAGAIGDDLFIAMEFVAGATLAGWLDAARRSWRDLLEVMLEAGRGLVAAHAVGLVHRDFKPDNVMIGRDGRVRVMDFGLARPVEASDTGSTTLDLETATLREDLDDGRARVSRLPSLTHVGAITGTPAYMAPEQFAGNAADERTDQFNFCVTAWEAFFGERPFAGNDFPTIASAVLAGEIREPKSSGDVPTWLRDVLRRGLATEPAMRWTSMSALLEALARGRGRTRARRIALGVGVLGLSAVAAFAHQRLDLHRRTTACEELGAGIDEVWNAETRGRIEAAIGASGVAYAAATADRVLPWLDRHAEAWHAAQTEACMNESVHDTWTAEIRDRAQWCLDDRRVALAALTHELERADADFVQEAVASVAALQSVEDCRDERHLARVPVPPLDVRDEIREVDAELARANASTQAGRYPDALAIATEAVRRATEISWSPLLADAGMELGTVQRLLGEDAKAEKTLEEAYFTAAEIGAVQIEADTAEILARLVGQTMGRHAEGRRWGRLAAVALGRFDRPDPTRSVAQASQAAELEFAAGDFAAAETQFERALALAEEVYGEGNPRLASLLTNLAVAKANLGELGEAQTMLERAAEAREAALGPDHPDLGTTLANLASLHSAKGELDRALTVAMRALSIWERALGPEHARVGGLLSNIADIHIELGQHAEAEPLLARGLAITEKALGPEHTDVAGKLASLAALQLQRGEVEQARASYERALAIREKVLEPDHPDVAASLQALAELLVTLDEVDRAESLLKRALAIREQKLGPESGEVADTLEELARVALVQGRLEEAERLARRAVTIYDAREGTQPGEIASASFVLGEAEWANGKRDEGRARIEKVRDILREAGEAPQLEFTEAWLRQHR